MPKGVVLLRSRRVGLASIILTVVLLVSPLLGVQAQWGYTLQAPIQAASGAVLGTATFTPAPSGGVSVHVQVRGFDPVAGSHRLAIATGGTCCPPTFWCARNEVLVLPDLQFFPDGSAEYTTVTGGLTMDWLARTPGTVIIIHADTSAASAVIGCGVITPGGGWGPGGWPPPGRPHPPGRPQPPWPGYPPPRPQPRPAPPPVVGRFRVTASAGLRLRSGPGLGYAIWRVVPLGTIVEDMGREQWGSGLLWARIRYRGTYYWAARQYLQRW